MTKIINKIILTVDSTDNSKKVYMQTKIFIWIQNKLINYFFIYVSDFTILKFFLNTAGYSIMNNSKIVPEGLRLSIILITEW